ncbi:MAG: putative DNA binding domain-containing protein [Deltaproteobacteria bacterium]|nr:putative DNA binding domain-containing protein [Deltaproteobacteria bacterium]
MPFTEKTLRAEIAGGEDSTRQFKADIRNAESLASEMAAFANSEGGTLYIGVADDGSTPGISGAEVRRVNQLVSAASSQLVRSPLTVHTENVVLSNGNVVIVLTVPKGMDKPYFDKNGVIWLKTGSDKRRVNSKEELRRLFQISNQFHADELSTRAGIDKLDALRFRDFLREHYTHAYPDSPEKMLRLLQNLNLATDRGMLNLAGVLMFAEYPELIAPQFVVKAIRYPGNKIHGTDYLDTEDFAGPLRKIFDDSHAFIMRNLHKVQTGRGVNAPGTPEIPPLVFEELLVNALIHRDYLVSASIRIFIYDNRVEIISPGHLTNNLTVAKIREGISNIRNPILASYAAKGLLPYHGLGSGINRALEHWPHIDFIDDHDGCLFKAIVHRKTPAGHNAALDAPESAAGSPESSPKTLPGSPKSSPETLPGSPENSSNTEDNAILGFILTNARMTTEDMGRALGISKRAVLKRIDNLKKQGRLRRVGPSKGGSWEIVDEEAIRS